MNEGKAMNRTEKINFINSLTVKQILAKMGGLGDWCFFPKIKDKGWGRYLEYWIFLPATREFNWRMIFKPFRRASIYISNIFDEELHSVSFRTMELENIRTVLKHSIINYNACSPKMRGKLNKMRADCIECLDHTLFGAYNRG